MHDHSHHHHGHDSSKNISVALFLNLAFAVIELIGGIYTQSVAIIADAIHDFGDAGSLAMALVLEKLSKKPSTYRYSYGYKRLSLLSAVFTGGVLVVGCVYVLSEAIPRLANPVTPNTTGMFWLAILGICVNGYAAWRLLKGKSLNEQVLSWHLIEDIAGWVMILIGSLLIRWTDLPIIDPILSILFTGMILLGVYRVLRKTVGLFLQAKPEGIDTAKMKQELDALDGVDDAHDIHVWSMDGDSHVLTLHLSLKGCPSLTEAESIKEQARDLVQSHGNFHVTIETELDGDACSKRHCSPVHNG